MAAIAVKPIVLKNVLLTLKLGAGTALEFQKHVSAVEFVPTANSVIWKGLGNNTHTDVQTASWVANLTFAQDWATSNSLSRFLFDNEGASVLARFEPELGGAAFTANLVVTPGSIGGTVDSTAVATVALGSDKPVFIPAP